jgi:allophanate hydrolase subunit 1
MRDLDEQRFVLAIHGPRRYHHGMQAGDNAELIELGDVTAEELHAAAARKRQEPGVAAVIPGHSSLYVIWSAAAEPPLSKRRLSPPHSIRVAFNGADLPELLARVTPEEFFARVKTLELTARYLGFRGGFAYLDGWPDEWAMPRRPTSRPVKRGTFAVAGNVAGFYPIDSPGGWNLLGHTDEHLEHAIAPGDVLRIEPVAYELISSPLATRVVAPNYDNLAHGRPAGGPFDDLAAAVATSAVRGSVDLLECAMIGPRVRFVRDAVLAWCTPDLAVRVERVRAGEERTFGKFDGGLRAYLAIGDDEGEAVRITRGDRHVIEAIAGPHETGIRELECEVTPQLDRVGIRLRTTAAVGRPYASLKSIGMQCGTVQLHPDGSVVVMGPDHPVTGGYLQPMTVITSERWKLAQLMPGERVVLRAQPPKP